LISNNNYSIKKYFEFTYIVIACNAYVILFYVFFKISMESILWSFMHATISSIILWNILYKSEKRFNKGKFSIASIFLIVFSVYFQISSVKYSQLYLYRSFISDNNVRFMGSLYVGIILYFSTELWYFLRFKKDDNINKINKLNKQFRINWSTIFFAELLMMTYFLYSYIKNPISPYLRSYNISLSPLDQLINILISIILALILCSIVFYFKKKGGYILLFLFILVFFLKALTSGSRSAFIVPLLGILIGLLFLRKISFNLFKRAIIYGPLCIVLLSIVFFTISGRVAQGDYEKYAHQISYRFDLSDFPLTLLKENPKNPFSLKPIAEALQLSIPAFLNKNKMSIIENSSYKKLLYSENLTGVDYTDSIFTMGIEIAGWTGFMLLLPLFVIFFELYDVSISKMGNFGLIMKILTYYFYIRIEYIWPTLFINIRSLILYGIAGYIFYRIAFRKKKLNYVKDNTNIICNNINYKSE